MSHLYGMNAGRNMDIVVAFYFDWEGHCEFRNKQALVAALGRNKMRFLQGCLEQTCRLIRDFSRNSYYELTGRAIQLRIGEAPDTIVRLRPHDVLLNSELLNTKGTDADARRGLLIGALEGALYHLCHPENHISQIRLHNLYFLDAHRPILDAMIRQLSELDYSGDCAGWLAELKELDTLVLLDRFWRFFAGNGSAGAFLEDCRKTGSGSKARIKSLLADQVQDYAREHETPPQAVEDGVFGLSHSFVDESSVVIVYRLREAVVKAVRVCDSGKQDALSAPSACTSICHGQVRTDVFHDHGRFISAWVADLEMRAKHSSLAFLTRMLLSDDLHTVHSAVDELRERIRRKETPRESLRVLYAALYYWRHGSDGVRRSVSIRVSKMLEDILTERPAAFPASRVNRSLFRGEAATVRVSIRKPHRIARRNITARVLWAVNGRRKKTLNMRLVSKASENRKMVFEAELPQRNGWIHYAVQISFDKGATWTYEKFERNSQGLLKRVPDERGQRVLSFYADTWNLKLDEQLRPFRDEQGVYTYGTFDDIAEQLPAIRAEGYTRIYPLGALELGWAGEAGPDPSVFSIWDGRTVRRDMGGIEGLLRLKTRAEELGMKVLLCVVSHFSRANAEYPYSMPAYIADGKGNLARRAGWDGEWDEWRDSFMLNMRDIDNVEHLAGVCEDLTRQGFGLRFDVGHGFDTVFPVADGQSLSSEAGLMGQVTLGGFKPTDLRGTWEPNISMLYICYRVQKNVPGSLIAYSEQWHGNEARMIRAGTTPYNAIIKNLESIRSGQGVADPMGLNENLRYLNVVLRECGGQTLSLFNTHDEESPASNYQNMIWPAAAFLVFSSYGPIMYHISRLPDEGAGSFRKRFDIAYNECWKHWVNNRFNHPWAQENQARKEILAQYPLLNGFGAYLRSLYSLADEHHALTRGDIVPLNTNNDRVAAFVRSYQTKRFLCVFNFPDPHARGQQAMAREFNFSLRSTEDNRPLPDFEPDEIYEFRQRYNNVEGRMRRGRKEFWSGQELIHLGFGGVLPPVCSHVYEIIGRDHAIHEKHIIPDSFIRYFRYGKEDRVRHSYIARAFGQALGMGDEGFERFAELFVTTVTWLNNSRKLGIGELSVLLAEISEEHPQDRQTVINHMMRIAVNEGSAFSTETTQAAADVLQSVNIGTIAIISPESKFSGAAGGVGIYTTDIADVLSELGFHIVIVTPLYECNRDAIVANYNPKYDGHSFHIRFPAFDESSQSIKTGSSSSVVNLLRARLARWTHGKRSRVDVLYLENAEYMDVPYGGSTAEDKFRRARILSQGALEALRSYNYYPSIIQTNEWPTWLVPAYLDRWSEYRSDPHFRRTRAGSMIHNPHPAYSIVLDEQNAQKREYFCHVLGLNPADHWDIVFDAGSPSGTAIDLMNIMLRTSKFVGTVSKAMRQRILDEPWLFGHAREFAGKAAAGKFFGRRNGFNMAARQRFWFGSRRCILETYDSSARRRLFRRCVEIKQSAKQSLQSDPRIGLKCDDEQTDHLIFGMLHRICKQKGFELLVDWKVYGQNETQHVQFEPWNMGGPTVLEHVLSVDDRIQFAICGRVEDSMDARRFDMHFRRIASSTQFAGRFAYYPEGSLPDALYRNIYLGSQYFVMPSGGEIGEPCGISQQEAHAGGTPVVAHHQDGLIRTVSDKDFGDTAHPSNGIKFSGYTGDSLLRALLDAREIYYHGRRLNYTDAAGKPKKLRYMDLCFNAFHTDHRWLRLLRDYVDMYADVSDVSLPEYLDAVKLMAEMAFTEDAHLGDVVLKKGMDMPKAVDRLVNALACSVPSVSECATQTLVRLYSAQGVRGRVDIPGRLRKAEQSRNKEMSRAAGDCLARMI